MNNAYNSYLNSEHWRTLRRLVLERDEYTCVLCNSSEALDVHHRCYRGAYMEKLNDLCTLCRTCHELADKRRKEEKNAH